MTIKTIFCWVASHTGIRGNEKADSAAKSALELPRVKVGVSYTDFKHISQYSFSIWQGDWNGAVANKLLSVKPERMKLPCVMPVSVTHLTHSNVLKKDPPPQWILTVRYMLVACNNFAEKREIFGRRDVVESLIPPRTNFILFKTVSAL